MTPIKTLFAALLLAAFATHAHAQQTVLGQWQVKSVNAAKTPDNVTLTLAFDDTGKAKLTHALKGEDPQTWHYAYTTEANTLTLTTTSAPGTPKPKTYEMKFVDGKLHLLTPRPEPVEGQPAPPDNREPIWILSRR